MKCLYCGQPVKRVGVGRSFDVILSAPDVIDSEEGSWTEEEIFCLPENMPGGVADDRVFPLHSGREVTA